MQRVRVVIPAYGAERTLGPCLQSLQENAKAAGVAMRVILVSDDGTPYTAFEVSGKAFSVAVRATQEPRSGPSAARNRGVFDGDEAADLPSEDYLAFCDADDVWAEGRLPLLLEALGREGAVIDNTTLVDAQGNVVREARAVQGESGPVRLATVLTARLPFFSLIRLPLPPGVTLPRWPDVEFAEDLLYNLMLFERLPLRFCAESRYLYQVNPQSISGSADIAKRMERGYQQILDGLAGGEWLREDGVVNQFARQLKLDAADNLGFLTGARPGETLNEYLSRRRSGAET